MPANGTIGLNVSPGRDTLVMEDVLVGAGQHYDHLIKHYVLEADRTRRPV